MAPPPLQGGHPGWPTWPTMVMTSRPPSLTCLVAWGHRQPVRLEVGWAVGVGGGPGHSLTCVISSALVHLWVGLGTCRFRPKYVKMHSLIAHIRSAFRTSRLSHLLSSAPPHLAPPLPIIQPRSCYSLPSCINATSPLSPMPASHGPLPSSPPPGWASWLANLASHGYDLEATKPDMHVWWPGATGSR